MLIQSAIGHPKTSEVFDLQNISPPEEINQLSYSGLNNPTHALGFNDIDDVVLQVERLISSHPNLPRLTRGEILDLLENITASDLEQYQHEHMDSIPRGRNPKAYMVVKAYSPEGDEASKMEELFTKTPVTQIVATKEQHGKDVSPSEEKDSIRELNKKIHRGRKRTTTTTPSIPIIDTSTSGIATTSFPEVTQRLQQSTYPEKPSTVTHHRRRRPTPANDLERTRKVSTTDTPITTYSSRRRRPIMRNHVSSTTEEYQNHRYPAQEERNRVPSPVLPFGEKIAEPSQHYDPYNSNDDLIMMENSRKEVPLALSRQTEPPYYQRSSTSAPNFQPFFPQEALADQASSSSNAHSSRLTYQQQTSYIADLEVSPAENVAVSSSTSTTPPSTTVPDISPVADNLSSEMRDLLVSFGLIQGPQPIEDVKKDDTYNPEKAEVSPESYIGFKPLPENDDESRSDMDLLLARFGLGRNSKSQLPERRSDESTDDSMTFDVVPQQYQGVLEDIGLSTRQGKKIRTEALTKTLEKINKYTPPKANSNQQEVEKLNKLLNIIQQIEKLNKTLTNDDVDNKKLKEVVESFNVDTITPLDQQNAPNPLNYDNGLSRNEIKREQNKKDATETKAEQEQVQVVTASAKLNTEETLSATASAPTKEEAATPNLKDLEDSFGGKTDPPTEPPATEAATKRSGFYYLVDWNTFLEVDDQKGKRVNLRFQPTIGDPKRFYSVSVP
nr:unnamed protein product [Callosobruchus chinensis]